ncbi:MAG TPA: hypothetical protein VNJ01_08620 [Bacteriovoracaceae bacterium]|nr:hypothetical protein [Bacteriovoracaceae bacterium]
MRFSFALKLHLENKLAALTPLRQRALIKDCRDKKIKSEKL